MDFNQFKEYSVAEFFKKNRQMIGFSGKIRSLTMIIHEYLTNSLDAAEESGILPTINLSIEQVGKYYKVIIEDNGPGLPRRLIGKALGKMLAGTKFHRYVQQRGQQGIGAAGCTMFSYLTTGKPIKVISKHKGKLYEVELTIDVKRNEPRETLIREEETDGTGLRIEAYFGDVKYDKSQYSPSEYIKMTALSNPHAEITFKDPFGETFYYPRVVSELPKKPKAIKPHPLGIDTHQLYELARESKEKKLTTFLMQTFARVTRKKIEELKNLVNLNIKPSEITWQQAEEIIEAIRKIQWTAPPTDCVVPIGKEQIEKSLYNLYNPEFLKVVERPPKIYRGGIPYRVEVGIAYGKFKRTEILRYANRVPLMFDAGACAITEATKTIDWKRYGLELEKGNIILFINFSSVFVPYTSAGKQAIAQEEEIIAEIRNAIMESARTVASYVKGKIKEREIKKKKSIFLNYVPQISQDLASLAEEDKEIIENNLIKLIEKRYGL